jgi:RHS repeat-associated protein
LRSDAICGYDTVSVTSLSSAAGSIANTYTYDSFGNLTASTGSLVNPFRHTARESYAETGLYYYRARYYDPNTGRFVSEDPIGFRGGSDFYRYVYNNPVMSTDPSGQSAADVQRIREACQLCADIRTGQGFRLPSGAGPLGGGGSLGKLLSLGNLGRLIFAEVNDLSRDLSIGKIEGCRGQAEMIEPCVKGSSTDDAWTFSVVPIWGGLHYAVQGRSANASDPVVMCDPWLYRFWTETPIKK